MAEITINKEYLGDSVYVEKDMDSGGVVITTDNGLGPDEIIYMEPEVIRSFERFIKKNKI